MQNYIYDYLIYIGRFSPYHNAHLHILNTALSQAKYVIVLIGSSNSSAGFLNPWSYNERKEMIKWGSTNDPIVARRILIQPLPDYLYVENEWSTKVRETVSNTITHNEVSLGNSETLHITKNIGIIGANKDESSYYLKSFPEWTPCTVELMLNTSDKTPISATYIREMLFMKYFKYLNKDRETFYNQFKTQLNVPDFVLDYIYNWCNSKDENVSKEFNRVTEEVIDIMTEKAKWKNSPWEPTFITTDAVVIKSGHILLIERGRNPGKGLIALPGGFLKTDQTLINSMYRELREETGLITDVQPSVTHSFDAPRRSQRGRVVTHAYLIDLGDTGGLPEVKGMDDAKTAFWTPLNFVKSNPKMFHEDHWHIIMKMINLKPNINN